MKSPILEYLWSYGIDAAYLLIVLFVLLLIMIVLYFVTISKMKALNQKYEKFMSGKDAESLEEAIMSQFERIDSLEASDREKNEELEKIEKILLSTYQKTGLVKYDAFREMSGKLSYAVALLDMENNGILINSMYSREGNYSYIKEIKNGESAINLSPDEEKALDIAVNNGKNKE